MGVAHLVIHTELVVERLIFDPHKIYSWGGTENPVMLFSHVSPFFIPMCDMGGWKCYISVLMAILFEPS